MTTESVLIRARKNRDGEFTIGLFESDGTTEFILAAGDNVRVKIGRGEEEPELEIDVDPSPGGSVTSFTAGTNDVTLKLCKGDTADLETGSYDMEIVVIDDSSTNPPDAARHVQYGVFSLDGTMGGPTALEESSGSSSSGGSSGSSSSSSSS